MLNMNSKNLIIV